jgi:transposase
MGLMTVPCVGLIAALAFKAAVDDRAKSEEIAGHGSTRTPRRFQSAKHVNPDRNSKAGGRDMPAALYAAANPLLMQTKKRA